MKFHCILPLFTATLGLSVGAAEPARPAAPSNVRISVTVTSPVAPPTWRDIADHTFEMRAAFLAGLKPLEALVAEQVRELTAQRQRLTNPAHVIRWDLAMMEVNAAQLHLKAMGEALHEATPATWQALKEKVGQAWARTQVARDRVRFSPMG